MYRVKYHISNYEQILPFSNLLLDNFQIKYFHFVRVYKDETRVSLTNLIEWMQFYYDNKFYHKPTFTKSFSLAEDHHQPWISLPSDKVLAALRDKFSIGNGITITEKCKDYCEFYYFATHKDNFNIYDLYINDKSVLKDFVAFFKTNASHIIKECELNKIPRLAEPVILEKEHSYSLSVKNFYEHLNERKYTLHITEDIRITNRELQCIAWCMNGKTAEEIGSLLGISKRAVEYYIINLKEKFNCYKLPELVYKVAKCGISIDRYLDYLSNKK